MKRDLGRFDEAEADLLAADSVYREHSEWVGVANNLHSLADLALDRGDLARAAELYRETIEVEREWGASEGSRGLAYCLAGLASVLAERGLVDDAARIWGAVCAAEESIGFRMMAFERRRYEQRLAPLEGTAAWTSAQQLTLEQVEGRFASSVD